MKKKIDFNKYITEHITDILGEDSIQKGYLKKFQKNFAALDMKMNELIAKLWQTRSSCLESSTGPSISCLR